MTATVLTIEQLLEDESNLEILNLLKTSFKKLGFLSVSELKAVRIETKNLGEDPIEYSADVFVTRLGHFYSGFVQRVDSSMITYLITYLPTKEVEIVVIKDNRLPVTVDFDFIRYAVREDWLSPHPTYDEEEFERTREEVILRESEVVLMDEAIMNMFSGTNITNFSELDDGLLVEVIHYLINKEGHLMGEVPKIVAEPNYGDFVTVGNYFQNMEEWEVDILLYIMAGLPDIDRETRLFNQFSTLLELNDFIQSLPRNFTPSEGEVCDEYFIEYLIQHLLTKWVVEPMRDYKEDYSEFYESIPKSSIFWNIKEISEVILNNLT